MAFFTEVALTVHSEHTAPSFSRLASEGVEGSAAVCSTLGSCCTTYRQRCSKRWEADVLLHGAIEFPSPCWWRMSDSRTWQGHFGMLLHFQWDKSCDLGSNWYRKWNLLTTFTQEDTVSWPTILLWEFEGSYFTGKQRRNKEFEHSQNFLTSSWLYVGQPGRVRDPTADRGRWSPKRSAGIQCSGRSWRKKNLFTLRNYPQLESLSCTFISLDSPPPFSGWPLLLSVCRGCLSLSLHRRPPCHSSGTHSLSPLKLNLLLSFIRFQRGQEKKGLCPIHARTAAFTNRS